jgi:glutaredoxin-related protein
MPNITKKDGLFSHLRQVAWGRLTTNVLITTAAIFVVLFLNTEAAPVHTHEAIPESGFTSSPAQLQLPPRIASSPTPTLANDETGYSGRASFERPSGTTNGWQYCLAVSNPEKKVFISAVFPRDTELKLTQALFADALAQAGHDPVQCPVSKYPGTARVMRDDAIHFNRKVGNAIVSLNWEPFSLSTDEDPIETALYTGNSSPDFSQNHHFAWRYCFARSSAESKTYFTAPFFRTSTLYADEKEIAAKLRQLQLKYDTVQCPNSIDQSSILAMRDRAMTFNQERGETIVILSWDSQS